VRALGANGSGNVLYLAVVEDGLVLDIEPYVFAMPTGLPAGRRLPALRDEAEKLVRSAAVARVRILDPETSWQTAAVQVQARFALETLLALGAADAGVDCDRLARGTARSLLELPKRGAVQEHVSLVTEKVGKHWTRKRDLAAIAALAAERQS
jgi:hypothetical protein